MHVSYSAQIMYEHLHSIWPYKYLCELSTKKFVSFTKACKIDFGMVLICAPRWRVNAYVRRVSYHGAAEPGNREKQAQPQRINIKVCSYKSLFSLLVLRLQTWRSSGCSHYLFGLKVLLRRPGLTRKKPTHMANKDKVRKKKKHVKGTWDSPSLIVPEGKSL